MYFFKECINKKVSRIIMIAILPAILLSGCDDKTSPPASMLSDTTATTAPPSACQKAITTTENKSSENYPVWSKNVETDNNKTHINELANIEKDQGRTLKYYSLALVIQADKTTQAVAEENFIPQEAQLQVTALDSLIASAQECYKAAPSSNNANLIRYSFLLDSTMQYSADVEERIHRQWNNDHYNESEQAQIGSQSEWMVKGSAGKVIRMHNRVVHDFNGLK